MHQINKIGASISLEEDGKIVKMIKFYLSSKVSEIGIRSTTFKQTFDNSRYILALTAGAEIDSFEIQSEQGTPWISIISPEEKALSDKNLPDFLSSIISEDYMRRQIERQIDCFVNGL